MIPDGQKENNNNDSNNNKNNNDDEDDTDEYEYEISEPINSDKTTPAPEDDINFENPSSEFGSRIRNKS